MEFIFLILALLATTIGALSGMGGGIIIKPVMDAISGLDISAINFMSGCTVLSMAIVSVYRGKNDSIKMNYKVAGLLAIGASIGGVFGKIIFESMTGNLALIQSIILFSLNIAIYFYVKFKHMIKTYEVDHFLYCLLIGFILGNISSFLGIGGGPINIVVLKFFFSSSPKVTAKKSVFIILFSQCSSFLMTCYTGVPVGVNYLGLILMIVGGCTGAILGGKISKKLTEVQIDDLFTDVLVAIIILNAYNIGTIVS